MFTNFLVPIEDSELSERAAAVSIDLAQRLGARVTGLVAEPMAPMPSISVSPAAYQRDSEEHNARTQAHAKAVPARFHQIAAAAEAFGEFLFGAHTRTVMSRCSKPLLVLH